LSAGGEEVVESVLANPLSGEFIDVEGLSAGGEEVVESVLANPLSGEFIDVEGKLEVSSLVF
jgi:hypothetical protein